MLPIPITKGRSSSIGAKSTPEPSKAIVTIMKPDARKWTMTSELKDTIFKMERTRF